MVSNATVSSLKSATMVVLEEHAKWITTIFTLTLLLTSLLLWKRRKTSNPKKLNLPPGPFKLPFIGNMHQITALPHRSLAALSHKHGPIMLLQFGTIPTLVVSSLETAQQILRTHDLDFASRPSWVLTKNILFDNKGLAFSPYGEYWRQVRKIYVLELLSNKRVQSFGLVRDEEVSNMIESILDSNGSGVNLSELFTALANDIVCRAAMGKKYYGTRGEYNKSSFRELVGEIGKLGGSFNFRDFFPYVGWMDVVTGLDGRQKKTFAGWDAFLGQVVEDHLDPSRDECENKDFVDVLLHLRKQATHEVPLTMDNIKAYVSDMIIGGTDTSVATLVWTMTELVKHPEIMKKAQEEVRRVVGHRSKAIEEGDIHKLDYLKSVIKETLRLHPPIPLMVPHLCIKDTKINGYDIPTKTMVYINAWSIGRDPTLWENPEQFKPDRFADSGLDFTGQNFKYIPFGSGRRGCPGTSFAVAVIELALANLLYLFDWKMPNGASIEDLDMTESSRLAIQKKSPLFLVATPHFI